MLETPTTMNIPKVDGFPEEERVNEIIDKALGLIQRRFVIPTDPEKKLDFDPDNELPFHGVAHTEGVIRRTEAILKAIQRVTVHKVTDKDIMLGKIAAAFHDVVQEWKPEQRGGAVIRKRNTGENEKTSANEVIAILEQEMESAGEIFSEIDLATIEDAIRGTVPGFDGRTAIQPKVTEQSIFVSRAVALADLGTAGMDGAEAFLQDGDALFREENLDIVYATRSQEVLSSEAQEKYRQRMIGWSKSQPKFAEGRRDLLNEELKGMPPLVTEAIKKLFNKFDESISASKERAEKREGMSFDELALDMGFFDKKPINH